MGKVGRPCAEPRCPNIITDEKRYCETHQHLEAKRGWSKRYLERLPIYTSKAWRDLRLIFLGEHPWCAECLQHNKRTPATVVHHIKPAREHPELAFVMSNLQSLCEKCHNAESQRESMIGRRPLRPA